jgi:hypothetical protein
VFLNVELIEVPALFQMPEYQFFFLGSITAKGLKRFPFVLFLYSAMLARKPIPQAFDTSSKAHLPDLLFFKLALLMAFNEVSALAALPCYELLPPLFKVRLTFLFL